jgi:hypothetical protein
VKFVGRRRPECARSSAASGVQLAADPALWPQWLPCLVLIAGTTQPFSVNSAPPAIPFTPEPEENPRGWRLWRTALGRLRLAEHRNQCPLLHLTMPDRDNPTDRIVIGALLCLRHILPRS